MGFSSGVPLLLIGSTLKAVLTEAGHDLKTIGFFSLVGLPYIWKFVWSPAMDRFTLLPIGRRRSWLLITQLALMVSIAAVSFVDPRTDVGRLAAIAVLIAFFSASQDIVVDAYRRDVLPDIELGIGSSLYVLGYRFALLATGAGALFLADHFSWSQTYWMMAALMLVGVITTLFSPEPELTAAPPKTFSESVIQPFKEFFKRDGWRGAVLVLIFVLLYKIGEQMASEMYTTFLLKIGFTKTEIAAVAKVFSVWSMMAGGFVGGVLIVRLNLYRSLWMFGILQGLAILLFSVLANMGANLHMLAVAMGVENFASGMATSAFLAFMASQTNRQFSATQYALLASLMGIPRTIASASTGLIAEAFGWSGFFIICTLMTIPGLLMLPIMKKFITIDLNPSPK
jgi:PAT family beta-lactamase induction signal transducer AmpG